MDRQTRTRLIARYKNGPGVVAAALEGATDAELLDRMSESDWAKEGTHPEHGPYNVERWLEIYAAHAHNHADQIERARASVRR